MIYVKGNLGISTNNYQPIYFKKAYYLCNNFHMISNRSSKPLQFKTDLEDYR